MSVKVDEKNIFTKEMSNVFEAEVIECPDCGFEFASKHEQDNAKGCYECPSCNECNLEMEVKRLHNELNKQINLGYYFEGRVHDLTEENKIYKKTLRDLGDIVTGIPSKMAKDALKRFK